MGTFCLSALVLVLAGCATGTAGPRAHATAADPPSPTGVAGSTTPQAAIRSNGSVPQIRNAWFERVPTPPQSFGNRAQTFRLHVEFDPTDQPVAVHVKIHWRNRNGTGVKEEEHQIPPRFSSYGLVRMTRTFDLPGTYFFELELRSPNGVFSATLPELVIE